MNTVDKKTQCILGFQHVLAMFGSTILVPKITGLDPTLAILVSGIGTLIFHSITKGIVPVYLGSSFAFVAGISLINSKSLDVLGTSSTTSALKSGIICAGIVYILLSLLIKIVGINKVKSFFPPIVNGGIIVVIGLRLAPFATNLAGFSPNIDGSINWLSILIAVLVVLCIALIMYYEKSIFKPYPILIAIVVGVFLSIIFDKIFETNFFDGTKIQDASYIGLPDTTINTIFTKPEISIYAITALAPIALVVFMEHIGDITTNGAVVGKDFFKNPGIHRTILGNGLATLVAGLFGGPPNTTYSENTGVLAITKVYDPKILRIAALFAIILSFIGKFSAFIQSIPDAVIGGVSIVLFGMIASIGLKIYVENKIDFSKTRNMIITALILILGVGVDSITLFESISISGLTIAAIIGVLMNKILKK